VAFAFLPVITAIPEEGHFPDIPFKANLFRKTSAPKSPYHRLS